jgi:hypothetical protein
MDYGDDIEGPEEGVPKGSIKYHRPPNGLYNNKIMETMKKKNPKLVRVWSIDRENKQCEFLGFFTIQQRIKVRERKKWVTLVPWKWNNIL